MSESTPEDIGGAALNSLLGGNTAAYDAARLRDVSRSDKYKQVFSDDDMVHSCLCLFENNLNVSRAANALYMHRNTLIYRIKKLKKLTGLNVCDFSDAVTFLILYRYFQQKEGK